MIAKVRKKKGRFSLYFMTSEKGKKKKESCDQENGSYHVILCIPFKYSIFRVQLWNKPKTIPHSNQANISHLSAWCRPKHPDTSCQ